jgi:frataxin
MFLEHLAEQVENLDVGFLEDVVSSDGVVTIKFSGNKVYVINKQSPNRQIWLSSPFS